MLDLGMLSLCCFTLSKRNIQLSFGQYTGIKGPD